MEIGHIEENRNYLFEGKLATFEGEKEVRAILRMESTKDEMGRDIKEMDFIDPDNGRAYTFLTGSTKEELFEKVPKIASGFTLTIASEFTRKNIEEIAKELEKYAKENGLQFNWNIQ